ncbi:MAG: AI-2E family transporter [Caldilineaceae bacterium]
MERNDMMANVSLSKFLGYVVLAVAVVALLWLIWTVLDILFLAFAGVLLAVFLRILVTLLQRVSLLPDQVALAVVILLLVLLLGFTGWFLAPRLSRDLLQLLNSVVPAVRNLADRLQQYTWLQTFINQTLPPAQLSSASGTLLLGLPGTLSSTLSLLADVIYILFIGLFLAGSPQTYYDGLLQLTPPTRRLRLRDVLDELIATLRWWILGQLFSMIVIGTLTGIGLWLLDMPFALALGVIAGLLEFIPFIGPILTGALAGLFALMIGPWQALYVILLYTAIQQFESNLLIPLVHQYTVSLPPVLTLTAFVIIGSLFGFSGILVATPLVAVVVVLIKMLYIQDVLGGVPNLPRKLLRGRSRA